MNQEETLINSFSTEDIKAIDNAIHVIERIKTLDILYSDKYTESKLRKMYNDMVDKDDSILQDLRNVRNDILYILDES